MQMLPKMDLPSFLSSSTPPWMILGLLFAFLFSSEMKRRVFTRFKDLLMVAAILYGSAITVAFICPSCYIEQIEEEIMSEVRSHHHLIMWIVVFLITVLGSYLSFRWVSGRSTCLK